jgi:hypothetical protein
MKTDPASDLAATRLAQAIRDYVPRRPTKFQKLVPMKDSIAEVRSKGASYATIADILRNINVAVASDTVFRFCHEVLGEPMTRRRRRRKVASGSPKERARKKPREGNATDTDRKADRLPFTGSERAQGPHIADPNTI